MHLRPCREECVVFMGQPDLQAPGTTLQNFCFITQRPYPLLSALTAFQILHMRNSLLNVDGPLETFSTPPLPISREIFAPAKIGGRTWIFWNWRFWVQHRYWDLRTRNGRNEGIAHHGYVQLWRPVIPELLICKIFTNALKYELFLMNQEVVRSMIKNRCEAQDIITVFHLRRLLALVYEGNHWIGETLQNHWMWRFPNSRPMHTLLVIDSTKTYTFVYGARMQRRTGIQSVQRMRGSFSSQ